MQNIKISLEVEEDLGINDDSVNIIHSKKCMTEDNVTNESTGIKEIEKNKYILGLVNEWIKNADSKNSIAFAMLSSLVAAVVFICDHIFSQTGAGQSWSTSVIFLFNFFVFLAGFSFLASIFFFIYSMSPRFFSDTKKKSDCSVPKYSIFYGEIKNFENSNDFVKCALDSDDSMFNKELLKEIYHNSRICSKKMLFFKFGIWFSFLSIVLIVLASLVFYINSNNF